MTLGAEPKKVAILAALVLVAVYMAFFQGGDEVPVSTAPARPAAAPGASRPLPEPPRVVRTPARTVGRSGGEFRPVFRSRRPEDRVDPAKVDPTLRLDLLAKVRAVSLPATGRNLFEFGAAPPPVAEAKIPVVAKIVPAAKPAMGPEREPAPVPVAPPPPPPPIPLKFYGFQATSRVPGPRRAFFMEGEEIHVVIEGEVIRQRYKVVRIGNNSVVVEDLQFKNQQTLPLEEAAG